MVLTVLLKDNLALQSLQKNFIFIKYSTQIQ